MSKSTRKPALVTATLAGSLVLAGSAFAATPLTQGYMLGAQDAATADQAQPAEAKAEHEGKCGEGKCGEGRCGMDKMDTDGDGRISSAEFATAHEGDASKFAAHDANGDGFIDAAEMKAHKEARHGDEAHHDAAAKSDMEGKCGEGKCGGSA